MTPMLADDVLLLLPCLQSGIGSGSHAGTRCPYTPRAYAKDEPHDRINFDGWAYASENECVPVQSLQSPEDPFRH